MSSLSVTNRQIGGERERCQLKVWNGSIHPSWVTVSEKPSQAPLHPRAALARASFSVELRKLAQVCCQQSKRVCLPKEKWVCAWRRPSGLCICCTLQVKTSENKTKCFTLRCTNPVRPAQPRTKVDSRAPVWRCLARRGGDYRGRHVPASQPSPPPVYPELQCTGKAAEDEANRSNPPRLSRSYVTTKK